MTATLLDHLYTIIAPPEHRDRDYVIDHVTTLTRYPLCNQPLTEDTLRNPILNVILKEYAEHNHDISEWARHELAQRLGLDTPPPTNPWETLIQPTADEWELPETPDAYDGWFLNLQQLLTGDWPDEDYLHYPLLPRGRQIALYATGKTGKSLLTLEMVVALATGQPIWGNPARDPINVLYVDYEMTPQDLYERLSDMNWHPDHPDLPTLTKHLHYAQLAPFPPFDTPQGGKALCDAAQHVKAQLVVIDTLIRSVDGEENSADTIKNFYQHTGRQLKAHGITVLRIDHAGKDTNRGQRGTSAKKDDVDAIWSMTPDDTTPDILKVKLDAARIGWLPHRLEWVRTRSQDGILTHQLLTKPELDTPTWDETNMRYYHTLQNNWPTLHPMGVNETMKWLRQHGHTFTTARMRRIIGWMKDMYGENQPPGTPHRTIDET